MTQRILDKHKRTMSIYENRRSVKAAKRKGLENRKEALLMRVAEFDAQISEFDDGIKRLDETITGFKSMIREGRKTVIKPLSPRQWEILQIVRQGYPIYFYADKYRYFEDGLYHEVNKQSVECLIQQGFLRLAGDYALILTNKGVNHKQIEKPCKPR